MVRAGSVLRLSSESQDVGTVMGREGARAGGTLNWAQGPACWEPWEDLVRLPWCLRVGGLRDRTGWAERGLVVAAS